MESTFVNQLHRSIEMFGLQSHKRSKSLKQKQTSARTSGQFKVLRDGFWSKADFQHQHDQGEDCKVPLSRSSIIGTPKGVQLLLLYQCVQPTLPPSSQDFNAEVSDQNFNEEEKPAKIDNMSTSRSNDQVVPKGIIIQVDDVVRSHVHKPLKD